MASEIARTFLVYNAFRSAIWCSTDIIWKTGTHGEPVDETALRVWSTGRWYTSVFRWSRFWQGLFFQTTEEWITRETRRTAAYWVVIDNLTFGIDAAGTDARIVATLIDARFVLSTISTDHALRSAVWRTTNIICLTRAHGMVVDDTAIAVRTAR